VKDWNTSNPEQVNITSKASFREVNYLEFKSLECQYFYLKIIFLLKQLTESSYNEESLCLCVQVAVALFLSEIVGTCDNR